MSWTRLLNYVLIVPAICCLTATGCAQQAKKKSVQDSLAGTWRQTVPGNFSNQSKLLFDSTRIGDFLNHYPAFKIYSGQIARFYRNRHYAYAWFEQGRMIEQAGNLANRVLNLASEGISQSPPYLRELDSLVVAKRADGPDLLTELMLTAQYFTFARLAWDGMDETVSHSAGWYLPRKKVNYADYLDSLLKAPSTVVPVYRQYELLRVFLRKYRELDERYKWLPVSMPAKVLVPGDSALVLPAIKTRLYHLEDFKGDTLSPIFDTILQAAIRGFQSRHGLPVNGLLDRPTVAELNVPLQSRIRQLIVNMERSRWLPVRLDADYLAVNIPEFQLHVYHADSLLWSSNVVVGQTVHRTTVFYGEMKYVVFSPYWDVPPSIISNELLPEMKKDPDYLATHHMQITGYRDGLPVIRQLPGPENSLGLVKFLFPNRYNIYLHDTPSKFLFGESSRAFSHGCIRIQEPAKLAAFLLKDRKEWTTEKINRAMHAGKEQYVTLAKKVPVFIAYLTAFTDRKGRLNFRKDIYRLDESLASMLLVEK